MLTKTQSKWPPSLGAGYKISNDLGVYANAMKSYEPGPGVLDNGVLAPQLGKSFEPGLKSDLRDKRVAQVRLPDLARRSGGFDPVIDRSRVLSLREQQRTVSHLPCGFTTEVSRRVSKR